jgi:hypothetical protein
MKPRFSRLLRAAACILVIHGIHAQPAHAGQLQLELSGSVPAGVRRVKVEAYYQAQTHDPGCGFWDHEETPAMWNVNNKSLNADGSVADGRYRFTGSFPAELVECRYALRGMGLTFEGDYPASTGNGLVSLLVGTGRPLGAAQAVYCNEKIFEGKSYYSGTCSGSADPQVDDDGVFELIPAMLEKPVIATIDMFAR